MKAFLILLAALGVSRAAAQTPADVTFVQHMIVHHAQALAMTELVEARTPRPDIRLMAERIHASQQTEIGQMRRWLSVHGASELDSTHVRHMQMPGMLSEDEMQRLAASKGAQFERLFLALMIKHHEGALTMVQELTRQPGGGEEPELFQLIGNIDADQRAEIARLRHMLQTTPTEK